MPKVQTVTNVTSMSGILVESSHEALNDLVILNHVSPVGYADLDFSGQADKLFEKLEDLLKEESMTLHHIIDVKTTFGKLGDDLVKWNELYDARFVGVDILPTQTACQMVDFDPQQPRIAVSITASKASKTKVESSRAGGGEPDAMIPGPDSSYPPQPMHFPWSCVNLCGDVAWLAGILDMQSGEGMENQLKGVVKKIDATLAQVGMTSEHIMKSHVIVPRTLSDGDAATLDRIYFQEYLKGGACANSHLLRAADTCAGCSVEITVIASNQKIDR